MNLERRVKELEQIVGRLTRELVRRNVRDAKPASIRMGICLGKTDSSINKGASGTVSIWDGPEGSESDTGNNVTGVYNRFANVGSGKWVIVIFFRGKKYLIGAECPLT